MPRHWTLKTTSLDRSLLRVFGESFPDQIPRRRANIPTIEQVGGDVDDLIGKRATMVATPWRWQHGDACPVRFVAMTDPSGDCRIDDGAGE